MFRNPTHIIHMTIRISHRMRSSLIDCNKFGIIMSIFTFQWFRVNLSEITSLGKCKHPIPNGPNINITIIGWLGRCKVSDKSFEYVFTWVRVSLRCAKTAINKAIVLSILGIDIRSQEFVFVIYFAIFDCKSMEL